MAKQKKGFVTLTAHSKRRLNERMGVSKGHLQQVADKAYEKGISHKNLKGSLKYWVSRKWRKYKVADTMVIYGNCLFLFNKRSLITVLKVPEVYMKNIKSYIQGEETEKGTEAEQVACTEDKIFEEEKLEKERTLFRDICIIDIYDEDDEDDDLDDADFKIVYTKGLKRCVKSFDLVSLELIKESKYKANEEFFRSIIELGLEHHSLLELINQDIWFGRCEILRKE